MWKANGKTATLSLFLDSLFPKGRGFGRLLDGVGDGRGYFHLKEETLDRAMWRNRFGGGFGPVVRQNTMNE
jgi:hypothetical protein